MKLGKYNGWIKCFRCDEMLYRPGAHNAYYIMGVDTVADEERERLLALKDVRTEEQKWQKENLAAPSPKCFHRKKMTTMMTINKKS